MLRDRNGTIFCSQSDIILCISFAFVNINALISKISFDLGIIAYAGALEYKFLLLFASCKGRSWSS